MFHATTPLEPAASCDIAAVLERLAQVSSRPRYAFMRWSYGREGAVVRGRGAEGNPRSGNSALRV